LQRKRDDNLDNIDGNGKFPNAEYVSALSGKGESFRDELWTVRGTQGGSEGVGNRDQCAEGDDARGQVQVRLHGQSDSGRQPWKCCSHGPAKKTPALLESRTNFVQQPNHQSTLGFIFFNRPFSDLISTLLI
jgi:hypothetical protein